MTEVKDLLNVISIFLILSGIMIIIGIPVSHPAMTNTQVIMNFWLEYLYSVAAVIGGSILFRKASD